MNYFDDANSKHFSFESFGHGLEKDTFGVINFKGYEAISQTYDFEIMLVSSNKNIDLEDMLHHQAVFTIHRGANDDVLYNGILAEFDQLHEVNDVIFYRARLVPKLWWLTLTHHNQVFLNQNVPGFVEDALRDGGLESSGFEMGTLTGYEDISYICHDESHFNFVSRWLEQQGIYYYFRQEDDGEIMVLTDTRFSNHPLTHGSQLFYNPASGLEGKHLGEAIGAFTCRQKQLPSEVILKDYNYERPSLDITSHAAVDSGGRGVSYLYGEFFATPEEGQRLASIRAEELLCQKQEFFGESTVPYIMPGFTFNMNNHYREDFNQEYLVLEVTHEGNQSHLMSGGITEDSGKSQNQAIYRNSFKAIPNEVQYRPQRLTEKPKISGTIHANIDSEVDGGYAQLDEQGRYRVKLPFDINDDHLDGKGSAPIRMMQAYAGKNRGMQFPLVKGTEVLLTFIEGNPDRPIIAGAVSNPETHGPVNSENQSESVIQTGGNNKIRMEDKFGSERLMLESPAANSWLRIGATNDPVTLQGASPMYVDIGGTFTDPQAIATDSTDCNNPVPSAPFNASEIKDLQGNTVASIDTSVTGEYYLTYTNSNNTTNTATRKVVICDVDAINDLTGTTTDGIRIHSAGNMWFQAKSRYGEYYTGKPVIPANDVAPSELGKLLANFGTTCNPTNLRKHHDQATYTTGSGADNSFANAIANAHVRVSSLDTFNIQEGNIYDFGGYWNYNLGNSYAENHMDQGSTIKLNDGTLPSDLTAVGGPAPGSIDASSIADLDDNTWIEKTIGGASYDYTKETKMLSTEYKTQEESHVYGKETYEYTYRGDAGLSKKSYAYAGKDGVKEEKWNSAGQKIYSYTKKSGVANEKKWDGSGALFSVENSVTKGMTYTSSSFNRAAKASVSASFGAETSASVFGGAIASTDTYLGVSVSNSNFIGAKASFEFTLAGSLKMENTEVTAKMIGFSMDMKPVVNAETTASKLTTMANNIEMCASTINNNGMLLRSLGVNLCAIASIELKA